MILVAIIFILLPLVNLAFYFSTPAMVRAGNLRALIPFVGGIWVCYRWQKDLRGRV